MKLNDQQKVWLKDALELQYMALLEGANDQFEGQKGRQEEFKAFVELRSQLGNLLWDTDGHSNQEVLVLQKDTYTVLKETMEEGVHLTEEYLQSYANGDPENGPRSPDKVAIDDLKLLKAILEELG